MELYHFQKTGKRSRQEDAYYISANRKLFVVCDGVGGSANGALASNHVIQFISKSFSNYDLSDFTAFSHFSTEVSKALQTTGLEEISTTIAMLYLNEGRAYLFHLGDSRIFYLNKSEQISFITKDHSTVQELMSAGILNSEEEMRRHPMRNRITKAIESNSVVDISVNDFQIINNVSSSDLFLLCSDGVLENYSNNDLFQLFLSGITSEEIAKDLEEKSELFSHDNSTCILIEI